MNLIYKHKIAVSIGVAMLLALLVGVYVSWLNVSYGNVTVDTSRASENHFQRYTFFASTTAQTNFGTTTSATSTNIVAWTDSEGRIDKGYFVVAGAKRVSMFFQRDAGTGSNAGSTVYRVEVTSKPDPTESDWVTYAKVIPNLTNTNGQMLTRVMNTTISAATSTVITGVDVQNDSIYAIRCIAQRITDGESECSATADY